MKFQSIGLMTQRYSEDTFSTLRQLLDYLNTRSLGVVFERETAQYFEQHQKLKKTDWIAVIDREQLGGKCDVVVVVGGDGSFLNAARAVVSHHVPLVGINRGTLGFLADIKPSEMEHQLDQIFSGQYEEEKRFLLEAYTDQQEKPYSALNEVILASSDMAKMIEFEICVDGIPMCSQRSDGAIIATPTGSTAYALSAGGPILYPTLDVIVMIPMFPHSLNHRPIVLSNEKEISIVVKGKSSQSVAYMSFDSHTRIHVKPNEKIFIHKLKEPVRLLHPVDYDYFKILRAKLGWGNHQ